MSEITPFQQFQLGAVSDSYSEEPSQGMDPGSSEQFISILQSMMMGGMSSPDWGGSSNLSSLFMPDMMSMLMEIMLPDAGQHVPGGWNNFPDPAPNPYSFEMNGIYGNYAAAGHPVNVPRGRPVPGPISQESHPGHVALDYSVVVGTPIQATLDGVVKTVGSDPDGYGNYVVVENGPYQVYFAHLSSTSLQVGERVRAGQVLGLSGNTGNSTGPHLHYEIRHRGKTVNPRSFGAV